MVRFFAEDVLRFSLGLIELARSKVEAPAVQAGVQSVRIEFDRSFKGVICSAPLALSQVCLRQLVVGIDKSRINPESISKLDRRRRKLPLLHVALAQGKVFCLCTFGISCARVEQDKRSRQKN